MKTYARFLGITSVAALFFACGEENVTNIYEPGMDVIAEGEDLPECDIDNQGKLVFSTDSGRAFFCNKGEWNIFVGEADKGEKGADGKSCSARSIDEGVEITCGKDVIDTLVNGKDGKDGKNGKDGNDGKNGKDGVGKDGENGKDGKSCSARSIKEGIEVSCDSVVIDTLVNGSDGVGDKGEDGASCTGTSIENVGVEISCAGKVVDTLRNGATTVSGGCSIESDVDGVVVLDCDGVKSSIYKAECDGVPYDPAEKFCLAGKVSPLSGKCGEVEIDLTKQFCDTRDNQVYNYTVVKFNGGQQVWMAQDLNYVTENSYVNEENSEYRLYRWYDAMAMESRPVNVDYNFYQGICPDGWHIPSVSEVSKLVDFNGKMQCNDQGCSNYGAEALKSSEENSWPTLQTGANKYVGPGSDEYGFSALPHGLFDVQKDLYDTSLFMIWTSASKDNDHSVVLQMEIYSDQIRIISGYDNLNKISVRCIMDY